MYMKNTKPQGGGLYIDRKWIAQEYGISLTTATRITRNYEDFPKPCNFVGRIKRYKRVKVQAWFEAHSGCPNEELEIHKAG